MTLIAAGLLFLAYIGLIVCVLALSRAAGRSSRVEERQASQREEQKRVDDEFLVIWEAIQREAELACPECGHCWWADCAEDRFGWMAPTSEDDAICPADGLEALGRAPLRCDGCGIEADALKTCRCRADRERRGVLCDPCWLPLRELVWIVPGPVLCFGTCRTCGEWASVNDLRDATPGGRRSAPSGTCLECAVGM